MEGRQEADDGVMRAVEQNTLGEALLDNGTRRDLQLDALNEAATPNFFRGRVVFDELLQLLRQVATDLVHIRQQIFFFQDRQIFESDTTSQRTSAERCAMLSGRDCRREFLFGQEGTERKSCRDRFGDRDDVGRHTECLEGEDVAGAPKSALDLVEYQGGLMPISEYAAFLQKL